MTNRNDWQVFYRLQVKKMGDLIHLPEVLPPRLRQEAKGEEIDLAEPSPTETKFRRNQAQRKPNLREKGFRYHQSSPSPINHHQDMQRAKQNSQQGNIDKG